MGEQIAILGGTFDPIHIGHLAIAEEVRWCLSARILFIPAAHQPLKVKSHSATAEDRLTMVRLATADNPAFEVCDLEVVRGGRSYTIDTLMTLRKENPTAEFTFVAGADVISNLHLWHQVEQLLRLCRFLFLTRPGYEIDLEALYSTLSAARGRVSTLAGPALEISATALRERLERGAPVRYQIPDAVLEYIETHGLYQPGD